MLEANQHVKLSIAGTKHKRRMVDHSQQKLTAREMVRAHAYPVLAAISTLSLLSIAVLLVPQAVKSHRYNRCIDAQIAMRASICLLYTSPSPRDLSTSRMPSSA